MARRVRKYCESCQQLFVGRRDAKTCGERCRKRLQRAKLTFGQRPPSKSRPRPVGAGR